MKLKLNKSRFKWIGLTVAYTLLYTIVNVSYGQNNLETLLNIAQENYPSIAQKQAEAEATKANVTLEKKTLLPSIDVGYDANLATYNNITGMNYPGNTVPISGPPSDGNYGPTVGSGVSLMVKWSPITFGQRKNAIEYNQKVYEKQLAEVENEVLRVQFKVAYLYLEIASTKELIKAYEKNIERSKFNLTSVTKLVETGLRPAVDSLKFKGELSKSKSELYQLENLLVAQEAELKEFLASDEVSSIATNDFFFEALLKSIYISSDTSSSLNPILKMAQQSLAANNAKLTEIERGWTPKLEFWGTTYARGSGVAYDGSVDHMDGFGMQRYNYGVGLQLIFPIMDLSNQKTRNLQQKAIVKSSQQYLQTVQQNIDKQEVVAKKDLATAIAIAEEVPVEFEANESAYNTLMTRYEQGLINYNDLIQAQYDVLNAEAKLKNAYAQAWKSLLQWAIVRGDINLFLTQIED